MNKFSRYCSDCMQDTNKFNLISVINTLYDIFRNHSTYATLCLLPDTWHWTDHCIVVCGKLIFYSNLKVALPLTQDCLNHTCCGNYTDENNVLVSCMQLDQSLMKLFKEY